MIEPSITLAAPTGLIDTEVYDAEPTPLAVKVALAVSVVLPHTSILIEPVWVPAITARNASLRVAYAVGVTVPPEDQARLESPPR
ncbi:MAG: hypothetical protein DMF63_04825 [Acidobacteria bacterium]|nr:MAG: hypothetical protein DMF63_04825 [Acidobacteriota bacterium]